MSIATVFFQNQMMGCRRYGNQKTEKTIPSGKKHTLTRYFLGFVLDFFFPEVLKQVTDDYAEDGGPGVV